MPFDGVIICRRGGQQHNCQFCSRYATKQCDFPVIRDGREGTCDAWLCARCAVTQHLPGCTYGTKVAVPLWAGDGPELSTTSVVCTCKSNVDWCGPHDRNGKKIMEARLRSKIGEP